MRTSPGKLPILLLVFLIAATLPTARSGGSEGFFSISSAMTSKLAAMHGVVTPTNVAGVASPDAIRSLRKYPPSVLGRPSVGATSINTTAPVISAASGKVHADVWEDATLTTIVKARGCLNETAVYLGMYYPQFESAFESPAVADKKIRCESLILGYTYQLLNLHWPMCRALAMGMYQCQSFISDYDYAPSSMLDPSQFPVRPVHAMEMECQDLVAHLNRRDRDIATSRFRYPYSPGSSCLRRNTREALVALTLFPGLVPPP